MFLAQVIGRIQSLSIQEKKYGKSLHFMVEDSLTHNSKSCFIECSLPLAKNANLEELSSKFMPGQRVAVTGRVFWGKNNQPINLNIFAKRLELLGEISELQVEAEINRELKLLKTTAHTINKI